MRMMEDVVCQVQCVMNIFRSCRRAEISTKARSFPWRSCKAAQCEASMEIKDMDYDVIQGAAR